MPSGKMVNAIAGKPWNKLGQNLIVDLVMKTSTQFYCILQRNINWALHLYKTSECVLTLSCV